MVWLIWEWMVSGSKIGLLFFLQPPLPLPPFDSEKCEGLWDHYGLMVWHLARTSLVTSVCVFSLSAVRSVVKPKQMVEELQMWSQRVERGFLQKNHNETVRQGWHLWSHRPGSPHKMFPPPQSPRRHTYDAYKRAWSDHKCDRTLKSLLKAAHVKHLKSYCFLNWRCTKVIWI